MRASFLLLASLRATALPFRRFASSFDRGVGLLHHVGGLLQVVSFLLLKQFKLLVNGLQVFRLFIVTLITMAAYAATLAKQILAFADGPTDVSACEEHVGGVAGLATCFNVFFREQRPEPVLVMAVRFLNAGRGSTVALVTRRTAELLRVVPL